MAAPVDAWSSEWADLRKLNRLVWYCFFGMIAILLIAVALGLPEAPTMILEAPLVIFVIVSSWRMNNFFCPRCGEKFFRKSWGPFQRQSAFRLDCIHCGLEKFTPSHKAKSHNKITDNWDRLF